MTNICVHVFVCVVGFCIIHHPWSFGYGIRYKAQMKPGIYRDFLQKLKLTVFTETEVTLSKLQKPLNAVIGVMKQDQPFSL